MDAEATGEVDSAGLTESPLHPATLAALGLGEPQDWDLALDRLVVSARQGDRSAQGQLRVLGGGSASNDWPALRAAIDIPAWLSASPREAISETPRLRIARGFLSPAVCEWLMRAAAAHLAPATVYVPALQRLAPHPGRTGRAMVVDLARMDVVVALVRARISATVKIPLPCFEPTQILHYAEGQRFAAHCDFLRRGSMVDVRDGTPYDGQRVATFLVYLNDRYEDGETEFPRVGWRFKGQPGDALYFANVDAAEEPDPLTLHVGRAPTAGVKWLLSQWIHNRTFTGVTPGAPQGGEVEPPG